MSVEAPLGDVSLRTAAESRGWVIGASDGNGRKRVTSPEGEAMVLHASDLWAELYRREEAASGASNKSLTG